jgi:hypothetical protein
MKNLFQTEKLIPISFSQRLLKKGPKENAFIEINNLFASKPLLDIKSAEIEAITARYKIDLRTEFIDRLKEFYLRYLQQNVSDKVITDQELVCQEYLKNLLQINDAEAEEIQNQLTGKIYKESFNEVISDGRIENSEKKFLSKLQKDIRLSASSEKTISTETTQEFMQMKIDKIVEDGKISPEEWDEFITLAKNLDVDVNWSGKEKAMVEKLKLYWNIEHGELPVKAVSIELRINEFCCFTSDAEWMENRKGKAGKKTNEQTAGTKFSKGSYYRAGTIDVTSSTSVELKNIDSGQVYLTNQRLLFTGTKENSDIQLNKILSINPFSDGVKIEKENLESPLFRLRKDADVFAMTLTRVINDFHTA